MARIGAVTARRIRVFAALALLALLTAACQMTVDVTTVMRADGAGTFRIVFAFDKEFIEVVRSTEQGAETLDQLAETGSQFAGTGWVVRQTQPGGGLRLDISRAFDDPDDLEAALRQVARESGDRPLSFPSIFRDFRIDHSAGFLRTASQVRGTVDLSPERLVPGTEAGDDLRNALKQAARDVFRFRVRIDLPGRVGSYRGDPESVAGGAIVWTVPFGETLDFSAKAGGYKAASLLIVFGPVVPALAGGLVFILRRRRRDRTAAVPGWEVASGPDAAGEPVPPVSSAAEPAPGPTYGGSE